MAPLPEIRYLGLHQRISCFWAQDCLQIRRLLLCCGVLLAVSEHGADDELEAVAIRKMLQRNRPRNSLLANTLMCDFSFLQVSAQFNGGFLPDIILLSLCYCSNIAGEHI